MKKRFLTLLLTVVLAVSCITPAVYAGTDNNAATQNNITMLTSLDTVKVLLDVLEEVTIGISTIDAE